MPSSLSRRFIRTSLFQSLFTNRVVDKRPRARFLTVGVLLLIAGCSVLPGHWRPGWNEHRRDGKPVPDTAGSWKLTDREATDGRFLALAISGGGSRAANFGAAVMLELQQ
ncbi:MAG: hypothetical protein K0S79_2549, partial [Nitrospira sp.]|nr:hypothetical protein [Nitrospira sp.]